MALLQFKYGFKLLYFNTWLTFYLVDVILTAFGRYLFHTLCSSVI